METKIWLEQLVIKLEAKIKDMKPSEFRFYNIAHFPIIAKKTFEYSNDCIICKKNISTIEKLVESLPESLSQNVNTRKKFEAEKNILEKHLQKKHKCNFPGYYAALGSLIGFILGLIFAATYAYFTENPAFNKLSIISLAVFLLIARGIGILIDRNIFKNEMQL